MRGRKRLSTTLRLNCYRVVTQREKKYAVHLMGRP